MESRTLALVNRPPVDVVLEQDKADKVVKCGRDFVSYIASFLYEHVCPLDEEKFKTLKAIAEDETAAPGDREDAKLELHKFPHEGKKYMNILQHISNGVESHLEFHCQDYVDYATQMAELEMDESTEAWHEKHSTVLDLLRFHTARGIRLVTESADKVREEFCKPGPMAEPLHLSKTAVINSSLDPYLRAPFQVTLTPPSHLNVYGIRDIQDTSFGSLMRFEVVIAKVFSSRPRVSIATYQCGRCHARAFQPVYDDEYNPTKTCASEACQSLGPGNGGELQVIPRECRMISHEIVLAQEPSHHVPQGNVPRRRQLILEGALTRKLAPGMQCTVTGIPEPKFHGMRGFGDPAANGKVRDTVIRVQHIHVHKRSNHLEEGSQAMLDQEVIRIAEMPNSFDILANSIAPSVFGLMDVKKALLLQLVGAPKLETKDGLTVRGEIHILMMGDPGVAKSQLLGKMTKLAPRSAYTSGKSASGVGLTASVFKDPQTGEFSLEGGAVVIADTGICGIDEFDKLDEGDRTAIHEVMEQQTVSISKAGLNVQLNARTAILAAANPTYGRYDVSKSVMENIHLPYSLVSRFDLQFLMLDNPSEDADKMLSMHILKVHQKGSKQTDQSDPLEELVDPTTLRYYVSKAQTITPQIPSEVAVLIQDKYVDIRAQERLLRNMTGEEDGYTTPRTLFSIIRLAQAVARLRFSTTVSVEDVDEAVRLMEASKKSIKEAKAQGSGGRRQSITRTDFAGEVLEIMRKMDRNKSSRDDYEGYLLVTEIENQALTHGYSKRQVLDAINGYVDLMVLTYRHDCNEREVGFADRLERRAGLR